MATLYDELGLAQSATGQDIQMAYRTLAQKFHPDRNPGREAEAKKRFVRIQNAYDVLSNPTKRSEYDESLRNPQTSLALLSPSTPFSDVKAESSMPSRSKSSSATITCLIGSAVIVSLVIGVLLFNQGDAGNRAGAAGAPQKARKDTSDNPVTSTSDKSSRSMPESKDVVERVPHTASHSNSLEENIEAHVERANDKGDADSAASDLAQLLHNSSPGTAGGLNQPQTESPKTTSMPELTNSDQQNVDSVRPSSESPVRSQNELEPQLRSLEDALNSRDREKVTSAINSIRLADPSCSCVRPIVDELLAQAMAERRTDEFLATKKALWVLDAVGKDANWTAVELLSLQDRIMATDTAGESVEIWYKSASWNETAINTIRNAEVRHEVVRLLAECHSVDQRIDKLFAKRVEGLKSAPQPSDRAIAALWLSRSMAISDISVPALLDAAKKDASIEVKRAAVLSLSGFRAPTKPVVAVVDKGVEYFKDDPATLFILLASLASVDCSDSSQFKRAVVGQLSAYKTKKRENTKGILPLCKVLECFGTQANWAIPQLLGAVEIALFKDYVRFENLSQALLRVGRDDGRVLNFYERAAKEGPEDHRVYCDSVAKQLRLPRKP